MLERELQKLKNDDGAKDRRNYGLDLLRIVMMFLIILRHGSYQGGAVSLPDVPKYNYLLGVGLAGITGIAVNCFIIISGYFLCKQTFRLERVVKLYFSLLFYSLLVGIVAIACPGFSVTRDIVMHSLFPLSMGFSWFLSLYLLLSLLSPFINKLLISLTRREYQVLLGIMLFAFSVVPSFNQDTFSKIEGHSCVWFVVLYCTGAYIRLHVREITLKAVFWGFVLSMAAIFGFLGLRYALKSYPLELVHPDNYDFLPTYFASAFCFLLFAKLKIPSSCHRAISVLSPLMLGCYLFHDNCLKQVLWKDCLHVNAHVYDCWWLPTVILGVSIVFLCGCLVEYLRVQLFKCSWITSFISWVTSRIQAIGFQLS